MDGSISTLSIERYDITEERGFLPAKDPVCSFGEGADSKLKDLQTLADKLPELLERHELRKTVDRLGTLDEGLLEGFDRQNLMLAARIYAFLTSAYVHQIGEPRSTLVPKCLAVPFASLSRRLGRKFPILSYDLYALNNWRLKAGKEIRVDKLDTIQKFVRIPDEPWFILVHVEIEAEAGPEGRRS